METNIADDTGDTADTPQDTRPPENMAEAAGLVSTDPLYDDIESPALLEFALALTGRFPYVVLHHIATIMNATISVDTSRTIEPGG